MQSTVQTRSMAQSILDYWHLEQKVPQMGGHNQGYWIEDDDGFDIEFVKVSDFPAPVKVCNTSMCAAGTAVFLSTTAKEFKRFVSEHGTDDDEWEKQGARLLGLTEREADDLFYSTNDSAKALLGFVARGEDKDFHAFINSAGYERL